MAGRDPKQTDRWEWHRNYETPGTPLQIRTEVVHRRVREFLDSRGPGLVRILSPCAGQGRELLPVIAGHPRRSDVRARLVELDPRNVAGACDAVSGLRLDWNVEIVCSDSSVTDAYVGAVPADLVVLCGVFGWIDDTDVQNTVEVLPELCAAGATVVWTLQPAQLDRTAPIRGWFEESGFREQSFESPALDASWVGRQPLRGHRPAAEAWRAPVHLPNRRARGDAGMNGASALVGIYRQCYVGLAELISEGRCR